MITDYERNNTRAAAWDKTRSLLGIALLAAISYQMGLGRGRTEKTVGTYSGLKSQYDRIEMEYSACKAQYDRTETQYAALKAQYDRIEAQRTGVPIRQPSR